MSFERIKRELYKDHEKRRKEKKELLKNGFLSIWNEDAKENAQGNTFDFYEARLCKKARKQSK